MGNLKIIGRAVPRIDAIEKVIGSAKFAADLEFPEMLVGKILRSPVPHARIIGIDTTEASRLPGVKAVITAKDVPGEKLGMSGGIFDQKIFESEKVRYIGDEIGALAAIDEETAEEALRLIKVEYEELPPLFNPEEALETDAPQIHDKEDNVAYEINIERGDIARGFDDSFYVYEDVYSPQMVHQCYIEPTACIARYDRSGKLTLWTSLQTPFDARTQLSKSLKIPSDHVRIIQTYMGGGFGGKFVKKVHHICGALAKETKKPVKLVLTREEEFVATNPRHGMIIRLRMGVNREGYVLAKETDIIVNNGAYTGHGMRIIQNTAARVDSLYRFNNVKTRARLVYTNIVPGGAYRGYGNVQIIFAVESHWDMIAKKLCMDPAEIRLKNATRSGDRTINGWQITSCGLSDCIKQATKKAGWEEIKRQREQNYGIGIGCMIYTCGNRRSSDFYGSNVHIRLDKKGSLKLICGEAELGQGSYTTLCMIAAEELGVPFEGIDLLPVDTDMSPYSLGAYSDRTTHIAGNATILAAKDFKQRLFEAASEYMESDPKDLIIADRLICRESSPTKSITLQEMASFYYQKYGKEIIGKGSYDPLSTPSDENFYGNASTAYTFAAQVAHVKVDRKTGKVEIVHFVAAHDLGKVINSLGAEGQLDGSLAQGIGYALLEDLDGKGLMSRNFLDYPIPTSFDMPKNFEKIFVETDDPAGPFGAKGVGEPGLVPTAPAIANAIYDAIGVRITSLPITPEKILQSLKRSSSHKVSL